MRRFLVIFIFLNFHCYNNENTYPQIIIDNKLEDYYDRAKLDLYALNISERGRRDYLIEYDSLVESKIYLKDTVRNILYNNKEITNNKDTLKRLFPNNFHYFLECELDFFEHERFPIIKSDTIEITFFPKYGNQRNLTKFGGLIHTIQYVNGEAKSYKRDDRGEGSTSDSELKELRIQLKEYMKNNDYNYSKWLLRKMH